MSARDWADDAAERLVRCESLALYIGDTIVAFDPIDIAPARAAVAAALRSARADTIEEAARLFDNLGDKSDELAERTVSRGPRGDIDAEASRYHRHAADIRALLTPDASGKGAG